jgi:acetylornithine deacetylase/succinyl-diaminopimelate desuccinylase-like protein
MIEDLFEFLRFPSVSADCRYRFELDACTDWLTDRLGKIGLEARKISTGGRPVVLGKNQCDTFAERELPDPESFHRHSSESKLVGRDRRGAMKSEAGLLRARSLSATG